MTPKAYLNTLAGVLCLVLIGAGGYGVWSYKRMAQQAAELKPLQDRLTAMEQQQELFSAELKQRAEFDQKLRDTRVTINHQLDKVTNEDPVARDYLGERIPDSVRDAIRGPAGLQPVPR